MQIADDETHFAALAASLDRSVAELSDRLDVTRRAPGRGGQEALERDQEIHRLTARLRTLRRYGRDLCLGRMVPADGTAPVYVGRLGLTDADGRRLLVDWRSPAAEPFFAATHAHSMGLAGKRRYRWAHGRIVDYWDEVFTADGDIARAALDDHSAFLAGLGTARTSRMRDVLGTIAADQDAVIRADSHGALVVDGGPGTGKTVVALHRAAYLLYADPRLDERHGGVLIVGPHQPYLDYVGDVLPGLGEDGVRTCTLRDRLPEGRTAPAETDPEVGRLKATVEMVTAVHAAVALYEEPPTTSLTVETPWSDLRVTAEDWAEAFGVVDPGTTHNEARDLVWQELLTILVDQKDSDDSDDSDAAADQLRAALLRNRDLLVAFNRAWPLLDAAELVGDLWTVPAYLRRCAPHLTAAEVRLLQRREPQAWTESDLPLLDAMRRRVGDPELTRRRRQREAAGAAQQGQFDRVIDELIAADDSELLVMSMLRGQDARNTLAREDRPVSDPDALAGPFAHIVVDEAQELDDAQWQMLLQRCPSGSFTIVGDRAQARHGFAESWQERLERIGLDHVRRSALTVNYRTPAEVMAVAEPVIRTVLPDANVPAAIRHSGVPVTYGSTADLDRVLGEWLAEHADGVACVVGTPPRPIDPDLPRVRSLTPELTKGLEFDLVVLLDDGESSAPAIEYAVDRYVAMTRATERLVVLSG